MPSIRPDDADWTMGDLAQQDVYPDEPPPQPPPSPAVMGQLAQLNNYDPAPRDVWDKYDTAQKYGTPEQWAGVGGGLATPEQSHDVIDKAKDFLMPQTPLDYALMATPYLKAASIPAKAAIYGVSAAMSPSDAEAGPTGKILKATGGLTGFSPGSIAEDVVNRIVKYTSGKPQLAEDPFHGFSSLRTGRLPDEMQYTIKNQPSLARDVWKPEDLMGSELIFTPGDRSAAGGKLTSVGGTKLTTPQPLEGGADYPFLHSEKPVPGMSPEAQRLWANAPGPTTGLLNLGQQVMERGREPVLMFQAMGKQAIDSSKQMAFPAIDLAKQKSVTNEGAQFINEKMADVEGFPGWRSPLLREWADSTSGANRGKLMKAMDMREARDAGFPDLGELRYALTNPQLRNTPTGSVGLTMSKLDPTLGATEQSLHSTYPKAVVGSEAGTFGGSVPWHVAAPDMHAALMEAGKPTKFAERPDYYTTRPIESMPKTQVVDQRWVDTVSEWMRKNPSLWATGAALPMGGLAAQDKYHQ